VKELVTGNNWVSPRSTQVPLRFKPCNLFDVVKFKVGMIVSVRYTNKSSVYFWAKIMSTTSQGFKVRWIDDDPRNLLHPPHHVKALPGSTESTVSADIAQQKANGVWNRRRSKYQWLWANDYNCIYSLIHRFLWIWKCLYMCMNMYRYIHVYTSELYMYTKNHMYIYMGKYVNTST